MKEIAKLVFVLTLISAVAGLMLAFTNKVTEAPIAQARNAEKVQALAEVLPPFDNDPSACAVVVETNGLQWTFHVGRKDGVYAGAAFESVSKKGYGGPIRLIVGVGADGAVRKIKVLEQQETPGLGTKVAASPFRDQFEGRSIEKTRWAVKKDGGDLDAITGATISSRAVADAVRTGLAVYTGNLQAISGAVAGRP